MIRSGDRDQQMLDIIRSLREGEVVTYGDIAHDAGYPGLARHVGHLLASTNQALPWWRVVNSVGRLVPSNESEQRELLAAEGVLCDGDRVRAAKYGRFSSRS
ncbi:MAG: MGMT family protein [Actinomycetota bacterium]